MSLGAGGGGGVMLSVVISLWCISVDFKFFICDWMSYLITSGATVRLLGELFLLQASTH